MPEPSTPPVRRHTDDPPFYVGYRPVPAALVLALRVIVPVLLWTMAGLGAWTSWTQRDPGPAIWDTGHVQQLTGRLELWPHPILLVSTETGDAEVVLLVEQGKLGVSRDLRSLVGTSVTITGWPLRRDGRRMFELEPATTAIAPRTDGVLGDAPRPRVEPLGNATLVGEIVDSKCYLGAMKPGTGKAHKACATLCIKGGIPPVLVSRNEQGQPVFTLLCDEQGQPLGSDFWPLIAEPVAITGTLERMGDLRRLRVASGSIRPL